MLQCRICHCYCDPSDLINGVCDDCREERKRKESAREEVERMMNAEFHQMVIEDIK